MLLVTAVNGNQLDQKFVVTYSDRTTTAYTQSLTDWARRGISRVKTPRGRY